MKQIVVPKFDVWSNPWIPETRLGDLVLLPWWHDITDKCGTGRRVGKELAILSMIVLWGFAMNSNRSH